MTVNNQTTEVTYTGDGVQKDFPVTFAIIDPSQVKWTPYAGNVVEVTPGSGNWVVRFDTAPTGEIYIYRGTPITQETQYNPYDAFPAEAHEKALDKLTQIAQELESEKVSTPDGDTRYLKLTGGVMSGDIVMSDRHITSLSDPVNDQDAVNKRWYKANQIPGIQGPVGPAGPPPAVTADANTVPWEEGADVTVTPDSDPYTGVHMDFQIPEGPVGVTPDFSADAETLGPEEEATVAVTQTGPPDAHAVNLSFAIPQGERGLKGEGIDFKGSLPTASDLPATGEADGDAWFIEDEENLYVWGGSTEQWENLGDVRGPEGEKGDQGDPGDPAHNPVVGSVTTETKPDGTDAEASVTANGEGNFDFDFKIPRGHSPSVNSVSTTTGATGTEAIVNVASTADYDLDFNFVIPKGDQGVQGPPGGYEPPIGMISMWSGNDVRDTVELNAKGWYLCDGGINAGSHSNASMVPDLTDKFIKGGAVGFNVGTFGGSSMTGEHTLSKAQMPSHGHTYATARSSSGKASSGSNLEGVWYDGGAGSTNTSQSQGGGESHSHPNVDPPHFVVAYIIYLGESE